MNGMSGQASAGPLVVSGYETSRDYEWLADEMQRRSVACLVDYRSSPIASREPLARDIARTRWLPSRDGRGTWCIGCRGIDYVHAHSREEFVAQCRALNVEVLLLWSAGPWKGITADLCRLDDALRRAKEDRFPVGCRVVVDCPRYQGPGVRVIDHDPPDHLAVKIGNGNVWYYPIEACRREDQETQKL